MRIGIDISQIVHEKTGVSRYVREMVRALTAYDHKNEYVLFGSSLRKRHVFHAYFQNVCSGKTNVHLVIFPLPPTLLEFLWNSLHILPIEWFIGTVDVFWSSDWMQPPLAAAHGVTTIHDLIALKFPREMDGRIVHSHTRRLHWVQAECQKIMCDSDATRRDVVELLGIPAKQTRVIYPGFTV